MVIEEVKGIIMIVKKLATAIALSLKSIFLTSINIKIPTITRTGYIAFAGIALKSGSKKSVKAKQIATTKAVNPVLPQLSTTVVLSTKAVTVEVPPSAPRAEPVASAIRVLPSFFSPSFASSTILPLSPISVIVPMLSKS